MVRRYISELEWHRFLSPQEHALVGSTVTSRHARKWYTPIAVQDGLPVQVAEHIRQCYNTLKTIYTNWIDGPEWAGGAYVDVTLPPLNPETGDTLYDPWPVDRRLRIIDSARERLKIRDSQE